MRYIANHYVRHENMTHVPGETFEADLSTEQEARLLSLGAISLCGEAETDDAEEIGEDAEKTMDDAEYAEADIREIDVMDGIGSDDAPKKPQRSIRRKRA